MPKTRVQKSEIIDELADKLARMKTAVFTSVSGYTMEDANALREKGRGVGVQLLVAKKTLLLRALEKSGFKMNANDLEGSILTAFSFDDEVAAAKLIADFSKEREKMTVVGGILEGSFVGSAAIKQLATLPSKEQLLAQLVRTLSGPMSGFVQVLSGNLRKFVYVLNAVKEAKNV